MKAKVAERGQVTIPLPLRKQLGIRSGVVLDFHIQRGKLIAEKAGMEDTISQVFGCLGVHSFNTDNFIHKIRGEG